jgi:ASC-1-like (ASCH) protein
MALFSRIFKSALSPLLAKPDHVLEKIEKGRYHTQLFFSDAEQKSLSAMFSIDSRPFKYAGIEGAMRIHFVHSVGRDLERPTLAKAIDYAIAKHAQAILFVLTPSARNLSHTLNQLQFSNLEEHERFNVMIHKDPSQLKAALEKPNEQADAAAKRPAAARAPSRAPVPIPSPIQAPRASAPPPPPSLNRVAADSAIPERWKASTLMKKYLYMIRNGSKPVEGRINRGMFAARGLQVGMGMRFFYQQNANDDVQCVIKGVKTFRTFREMLEHYGWQKCVPDARGLEDAVQIYARIPGYARKESESGVIGIELEVLGSGPDGPYHKRPQLQETPQAQNRKRSHHNGAGRRDTDYDHRAKSAHYMPTPRPDRRHDQRDRRGGYGGSRYDDRGSY